MDRSPRSSPAAGSEPILVITHSFDVEDADHRSSGLEEAGHQLAEMGIDAKLIHRFASNVPLALGEAGREWGAALIVMVSFVKPGAPRLARQRDDAHDP